MRPYLFLSFLSGCLSLSLFAQETLLDSAKTFDNQSNFQKAEIYFEKYLDKKTQKDSSRIEALIALARTKRINQKYLEGIAVLKRAKAESDSIQNKFLRLKTEIHIGDYYRTIGALGTSYGFFNNLNPSQFEKYPRLFNLYLHRKAAIYNEMPNEKPGDSTDFKALEFSKRALKIARKNNWPLAIATSHNEMAHIYKDQEKYGTASAYIDSAQSIFIKESKIDYVNASSNKMAILYALKEYDKCIELGKSLLKISEERSWTSKEHPILHGIANCYFKKNDSLNGLKYELLSKDKYIETIKAMFQKDLTEAQVKFDISNKELEIKSKERVIEQSKSFQNRLLALLGFSVLLIALVITLYLNGRRKNIKLEALLKENAFLIGEANHRIKNNLQLIISLLSKEIRKPSSKNSQQLLDIKAKIESISTLHQLLYLNEDKSTINIGSYLEEIVNNFKGVLEDKEVHVKASCHLDEFPIEKSLHLGLLLTELIINTLKHAYNTIEVEEKGIEFSLAKANQSIVFNYRDNGEGLKEGKTPKLISLLVKQLQAKQFGIKKKGYNFTIEIPI